MLSEADLQREAAATGFRVEALEKVIRLLELLEPADSKRIGAFGVTQIPMLDLHELAAGKLGALFGRAASRDLFDVRELLATMPFDAERLRLGFVVYGGINRRDWRTVALDDVQADPGEVDRQLVPLLRATRLSVSHSALPLMEDIGWRPRETRQLHTAVNGSARDGRLIFP